MKQIYDYIKEILEILGIEELTKEKEEELYRFILQNAYWEVIDDWYNDCEIEVFNYTEMIENAQNMRHIDYTEEELNEIDLAKAIWIFEDCGYKCYLLI